VPENQSRGRQLIIQGDCNIKNILVLGINILLRVIELQKKKSASLAFFKGVEVNIWGLKINQEAGR
jgi:hypothetical protein